MSTHWRLESDLSNDPSFRDLLQQVKQTTMAAYAHQEVPFEQIVDRVEQGRDLSRSPIYQMVFVMQNTPEVPDLKLGNLELKGVEFEHQTSLYDMTFNVNEGSEELGIEVEYCVDLFRAETIDRLMGHYEQLLQSVLEDSNRKASVNSAC